MKTCHIRKYIILFGVLLFFTAIDSNAITQHLSGLQFRSFGMYKTEKLMFINDSLCVYKQKWDSVFPDNTYQYLDTFVYKYCDTIISVTTDRIERITIRNVNSSKSVSNQREPINEEFYNKINFGIPRSILFPDLNTKCFFTAPLRRSQYNMWDMPRYSGKKTKFALSEGLLYNIAYDTLYLYDSKVVSFSYSLNSLFASDTLEGLINDSNQFVTNQEIYTTLNSYEYQRYAYYKHRKNVNQLNLDSLIGRIFYYYEYDFKDAVLKESLHFLNKKYCVCSQIDKNKTCTCRYEIKDNLIVLENPITIDSNQIKLDTLAYNQRFIFYAQNKVSSNSRIIDVKVFHEIVEQPLKRQNKGWLWVEKKKRYYTFPEYEYFDKITFDTYIPINHL